MRRVFFLCGLFLCFTASHLTLPISGSEPGVTFPVCDVEMASKRLSEVDYLKAVEAVVGEVEASSHRDSHLVPTHANAFLEATYLAFSGHRPLVLSPDMIWLTICQGFARHVDANAESLRYRIVAHDGKKTIQVKRANWEKGRRDNPWEQVFPEFCDSMQKYLVSDLHEVLLPTFSTTSMTEKTAFRITFMDALDSYFAYEFLVICGIPSITLEGTPEDWDLVLANAMQLRTYDLAWWIDNLVPILEQFAAASRGRVDSDFWGSIYTREAESGQPRVNGWISKFYPYLPATSGESKRNPFIEQDPEAHEGLKIGDFPTGICKTDFLWIDLRKAPPDTFPMEFMAGFVGIFQDSASLALRPEIGWIVRDDPDR